jgi:hypothetical protein
LRYAARERQGLDDLFGDEGDDWRWSVDHEPDLVGWRRVLRALEALPCEVLFVKMPLVEGFEETFMADMQQRFEREIVGAISARGWTYLDLNGEPWPHTRPYFLGLTHLNFEGAELATELFTRTLLVPRLRGRSER